MTFVLGIIAGSIAGYFVLVGVTFRMLEGWVHEREPNESAWMYSDRRKQRESDRYPIAALCPFTFPAIVLFRACRALVRLGLWIAGDRAKREPLPSAKVVERDRR